MVLLCLPLAAGAWLAGCGRGANTSAPSIRWQPFQASYRLIDANGQTLREGNYMRWSDGSDRRDVHATNGEPVGIQIRNIALNTCYRFNPLRGWTAQPMRLPVTGWRPPAVGPANGRTVTFEGRPALQVTSPSGDMAVVLEELDFFRATRVIGRTKRRHEYYDFVIGQPPAQHLEPPQGTRLIWLSTVAGIIADPSLAAQEER